MISIYPIGGAPTASLGELESALRHVVSGGAFAGGAGAWETDHFPIEWKFTTGGALAGGRAKYPPRFGYPTAGGMVAGGKAKFPVRWTMSTTGIVGGGQAKYPPRWNIPSGGISGRTHPMVGMTDWVFKLGFPGTFLSGATVGGRAHVGYLHYTDVMLKSAEVVTGFTMTTTTPYLILTEV